MTDAERLRREVEIQQQRNIQNDARIKSCIEHYDNDTYSRLQFLQAISHSLGTHTEAFHAAADADSNNEDDTSDQSAVINAPAAATHCCCNRQRSYRVCYV